MPTIKKFTPGAINFEKIVEELAALSLPMSTTYAGFQKASDLKRRVRQRFETTQEVGRRSDSTGLTIDTADPGEIRFTSDAPLRAEQEASIDAALTAHDSTQLTQEQTRTDKDEATLSETASQLERATWNTLTLAQQMEILRRSCQLLFRGEHFDDLDTDD